MATYVEDDPMLSSHPGAGNHCDSLKQNDLWQNSLGIHPGLHSVKRNATAVTLRSGQIIELHSLKQK